MPNPLQACDRLTAAARAASRRLEVDLMAMQICAFAEKDREARDFAQAALENMPATPGGRRQPAPRARAYTPARRRR